MRLTEKFIQKLNNDLGLDIPIDTKITHLHPSINQEARGMFKWVFKGSYSRYGSSQGIRELSKCKKLKISYTTIGGLSVVASSLYEILGEQ